MKKGVIYPFFFSLLALAYLPGCQDKNVLVEHSTRQIGEPCDNNHKCLSSLICEDGICRVICNNKSECNKGQDCINRICTNISGQDDGQTDPPSPPDGDSDEKPPVNDEKAIKLPTGGSLNAIGGTTTDGHFKIQVLGNTLSGEISDGHNKIQTSEGSWK